MNQFLYLFSTKYIFNEKLEPVLAGDIRTYVCAQTSKVFPDALQRNDFF
jgi:hypothetical protein